jgi:hypothetical protein
MTTQRRGEGRVSYGPIAVAPGGFVPVEERRLLLAEALSGLELGGWDERMMEWLVGWDADTVLTIASWIVRARESGALR